MEIGIQKTVQVQAKTLCVHLKVCDMFTACIKDQDDQTVFDQEDGYVPGFMPGEHYGDYVILDIDLDTGQITNWKTPTAEQIQEFINKEE